MELIRKVRSGRQDGWGVLLYPDDKQGLCQAAGLFCQTAVQNAQTLAYSCHFRKEKKFAHSFICAEWRQRLGRLHIVEPQLLSEKLTRAGHPSVQISAPNHERLLV